MSTDQTVSLPFYQCLISLPKLSCTVEIIVLKIAGSCRSWRNRWCRLHTGESSIFPQMVKGTHQYPSNPGWHARSVLLPKRTKGVKKGQPCCTPREIEKGPSRAPLIKIREYKVLYSRRTQARKERPKCMEVKTFCKKAQSTLSKAFSWSRDNKIPPRLEDFAKSKQSCTKRTTLPEKHPRMPHVWHGDTTLCRILAKRPVLLLIFCNRYKVKLSDANSSGPVCLLFCKEVLLFPFTVTGIICRH